jgi:hypothetical protein
MSHAIYHLAGRLLLDDDSFGYLLSLEPSAHKALNQALLFCCGFLSFGLTGPPRRGQQYTSSSYCYLPSFSVTARSSIGAAELLFASQSCQSSILPWLFSGFEFRRLPLTHIEQSRMMREQRVTGVVSRLANVAGATPGQAST